MSGETGDIFEGITDLDESQSNLQLRSASPNKLKKFSPKEEEEGFDKNELASLANRGYSYFDNKLGEISSVTNSAHLITVSDESLKKRALLEVLSAKQHQILKAFQRHELTPVEVANLTKTLQMARKDIGVESEYICMECGVEVTHDFFQLVGDHQEKKYVCQNCLRMVFICKSCGEAVQGSYFVGHGLLLHPHCLKKLSCSGCSRFIDSSRFIYTENGHLFHLECVPNCKICGLTIGTSRILANGFNYHPNCFRCVKCAVILQGVYYTQNDLLYCTECGNVVLLRCDGCHQRLEGEYLTFANKSFHPKCFKCSVCKNPCNSFFVVKNQIVCRTCSQKKK